MAFLKSTKSDNSSIKVCSSKEINPKVSINKFFLSLMLVATPQISYAYNFCQTQPVGGDTNWDIIDNGSSTIPVNFSVGDEATNIEQITSVTIKGYHQYAGDLAAELIPPGGSAQGTAATDEASYDSTQSVILFRLGDGRYGEGASNCNEADFDLIFTDTSTGTDLSRNDQNNYCTGTNNRGGEGVWPQPYLPNFPNVGNSPALNGNPITYESQGITSNKLSNLIGLDPRGTWGVFVEDAYAQDVGTVTEVCIDMDFGSVTYDIFVSKNASCTDKKEDETFDFGETVYLCYEVSNQATEDFMYVSETNDHGANINADLMGLYEDKFSGTTTHREAYRSYIAGDSNAPVGTTTLSGSITVEGSGTYFSPGEFITTSEAVTITVNPPTIDLKITKTVNDATPNIGDIITFSLLVENLGPDTATNVSVKDIVPAGFTYVADSMTGISPSVAGITADQSSPTGTGLQWIIDLQEAGSGGNETLTFQASVNAP